MNPKDGFAVAEDVRAKRILEFLIPILYLEKPTRVTMTVGNTIFEALLGDQRVDWGLIFQSVVTKLVEATRKLKAMPIEPYLFHLYVGQEVLCWEEMVTYDIGLDLLKYNCTPEAEPDQDSPPRPNPQPSPSVGQSNRKSNNRPSSFHSQDARRGDDLTQQEIEEMANSFTNAIKWMELPRSAMSRWMMSSSMCAGHWKMSTSRIWSQP